MGSFYVVGVIHLLDLCFIIIKYSRRLSPKHIKNINPPCVPFWKLCHYTPTACKLVATAPPALNLIVLHLHIFELFALHLFWGGVGVDTHVTIRGQVGGQQFPPATFQVGTQLTRLGSKLLSSPKHLNSGLSHASKLQHFLNLCQALFQSL